MLSMKYLLIILFACSSLLADTATNLVVVNSSTNDCALTANGGVYLLGGNGDVNGDGKLTTLDITFSRRFQLYGTNFTAEQYARADVNGDGLVNSLDITLMRQAILGIIPRNMMSGNGKWIASRQSRTDIPPSSNYDGEVGQTACDTNWFYICVEPNKWKRIKLESW